MKCLSIKPPWSLAIFKAKDVENRSWATNYRGPLLIHSSKSWDEGALYRIREIAGRQIVPDPGHPDYAAGHIIGQVRLVACRRDTNSPWGEPDMFHWVMAEPVLFNKPIRWRGQLGLFNVPDEVLREAEND